MSDSTGEGLVYKELHNDVQKSIQLFNRYNTYILYTRLQEALTYRPHAYKPMDINEDFRSHCTMYTLTMTANVFFSGQNSQGKYQQKRQPTKT